MADWKLPRAENQSDQRVIDDVRHHGWHIIHVGADADGPGWSFSIGLYYTFGVPEFMIFGLPISSNEVIINGLGVEIRAGQRFSHGTVDANVLERQNVQFVTIARTHYRAYLGYAIWFYNGMDFPTLQIVWPDKHGRFPWDARCAFDDSVQPVLGAL